MGIVSACSLDEMLMRYVTESECNAILSLSISKVVETSTNKVYWILVQRNIHLQGSSSRFKLSPHL